MLAPILMSTVSSCILEFKSIYRELGQNILGESSFEKKFSLRNE